MIRGVGRGFISGWWGLVLIGFALGAVMVCTCCWCHGVLEKRRRRLSLAQHADSDLTLREDSPKFLKLLANKENVRRCSNINLEAEGLGIKNCIVEYSGSVCPYPNPLTADQSNNIDMIMPGSPRVPSIPIPMIDD